MTYKESIEYISSITTLRGISPGLDNIRQLCDRLGNPQEKLRFVHIAGTNGKGSTLAFISSILTNSGYKVGRYISPTIRDYRERIQINGTMIGTRSLSEYMDKLRSVCDAMVVDGLNHPSAFEIETALAFLYFCDKRCDVVVLETGMGGQDDATNIVTTTILSVITNVSMDHMQYLGDDITQIARQKCGIIKQDIPVVTGFLSDEVYKIVAKYCRDKNARLYRAMPDEIGKITYKQNKQSFVYEGHRFEIGLLGVHQNENALIAIKAAKVLSAECGFDRITIDKIQEGLVKTTWPARFHIVSKKPLFILDGAHNEDAAIKLKQTIDILYKDKSKIIIIGMFRDKENDKVARIITKDASMVFTCSAPSNPRALSAIEMADIVRRYNSNVTSADSVEEAVEFASSVALEDSVIIACGSLAYLGRIIDIFDIK